MEAKDEIIERLNNLCSGQFNLIQDLRKEIEDLKKNCQCESTTENSSLSTKISEVSKNWRSLLTTLKKEAGESSEAGQIEVDEEGSG